MKKNIFEKYKSQLIILILLIIVIIFCGIFIFIENKKNEEDNLLNPVSSKILIENDYKINLDLFSNDKYIILKNYNNKSIIANKIGKKNIFLEK